MPPPRWRGHALNKCNNETFQLRFAVSHSRYAHLQQQRCGAGCLGRRRDPARRPARLRQSGCGLRPLGRSGPDSEGPEGMDEDRRVICWSINILAVPYEKKTSIVSTGNFAVASGLYPTSLGSSRHRRAHEGKRSQERGWSSSCGGSMGGIHGLHGISPDLLACSELGVQKVTRALLELSLSDLFSNQRFAITGASESREACPVRSLGSRNQSDETEEGDGNGPLNNGSRHSLVVADSGDGQVECVDVNRGGGRRARRPGPGPIEHCHPGGGPVPRRGDSTNPAGSSDPMSSEQPAMGT